MAGQVWGTFGTPRAYVHVLRTPVKGGHAQKIFKNLFDTIWRINYVERIRHTKVRRTFSSHTSRIRQCISNYILSRRKNDEYLFDRCEGATYGVQIPGEQVGNKTTYTYIFDVDVKGMTTGGGGSPDIEFISSM